MIHNEWWPQAFHGLSEADLRMAELIVEYPSSTPGNGLRLRQMLCGQQDCQLAR